MDGAIGILLLMFLGFGVWQMTETYGKVDHAIYYGKVNKHKFSMWFIINIVTAIFIAVIYLKIIGK